MLSFASTERETSSGESRLVAPPTDNSLNQRSFWRHLVDDFSIMSLKSLPLSSKSQFRNSLGRFHGDFIINLNLLVLLLTIDRASRGQVLKRTDKN